MSLTTARTWTCFAARSPIAPQDRVAERLGKGDGNVERALARWQREHAAFAGDLLDDRFDLADVARDQPVERHTDVCRRGLARRSRQQIIA